MCKAKPQMHPSSRGARRCGQKPLEKVHWSSVRNGPCVWTFCFWTFRPELLTGVTLMEHFVCSHQRGTLECSKGAHMCCPWLWSQVCCWQSPASGDGALGWPMFCHARSRVMGGWRCPCPRVIPPGQVPETQLIFLLLSQILFLPILLSGFSSFWRIIQITLTVLCWNGHPLSFTHSLIF